MLGQLVLLVFSGVSGFGGFIQVSVRRLQPPQLALRASVPSLVRRGVFVLLYGFLFSCTCMASSSSLGARPRSLAKPRAASSLVR